MKRLLLRKEVLLTGVAILVVGIAAAAILGSRGHRPARSISKRNSEITSDEAQEEDVTTVKVVRPKFKKTFSRTVSGFSAYVEAYYKADLFAHVAGPVKFIEKNIGDRVVEGELLVEIDVPDLLQELTQKQALIKQAEAALTSAQANVATLQAEEKTGPIAIDLKLAELDREKSLRDLSKTQMLRYKGLAEREGSVAKETVDEKIQAYRASEAACKGAEVAVKKARLDLEILAAKIVAAQSDAEVQKQRVAVAQADMKRLQSQVDFARIRAPFNGVIVSRNVDPGSFVQNATTGRTQPFLSLVRIDKITVTMQVPESAAPYISPETQASITMETGSGKPIRNLKGTVSRFAPYLDPERGRTMQLEVDLYNPPERGYKRSVTRGVSAMLGVLGATGPIEAADLFHAGRTVWNRPGLLRPGMYGTMKLYLQKFNNVYLVPSGAVYSQQDKSYLFLVKDGVAHRAPVRVQLDDGVQAKVAFLVHDENPEAGDDEVLRELTGDEDIIASGQGEVAEGQQVLAVRAEW